MDCGMMTALWSLLTCVDRVDIVFVLLSLPGLWVDNWGHFLWQ